MVGGRVLIGPQELGQEVEVGPDLVAAGRGLFVHPDDDPFRVDEFDDPGPLADDDVPGPDGHQALDPGADERGLGTEEGDGLPLHVRPHQGAVGVVVLQEGDESGRQGDELFRRDVDIVELVAGDELEVAPFPGADHVAREPAAVVDGGVGLGDVELLLLPGGEVEAMGLDDRQLAGLLVLELVDGLGHLVLLDDVADLAVAASGMNDLDVVDDPAVLDLPVGGLHEPVVVDPGETAERRDQPDVGPFRRLDRAEPPVVGGLDVADLEAGPLAAQAAGAEGRQPALVGDLGQAVDLVHELGELGAAEELLEGGDDRLGVEQVLGHGGRQVGSDGHLLFDGPLHPRQADAERVLDELADRTHPAVAQMVDVVDRPLPETQVEEILDDLHVIEGGQGLLFEGRFLAELDVELEPADPGEIIFLGIEEQAAEEVLRALGRVRLPGSQFPVDLTLGLGQVLAEVLLDGRADDQAGPVLFGEEDLERLPPPDEQVELDVVDLLVRPDLAFDTGQGIGPGELFLRQGDPGDARAGQGRQDLGTDLLPGRSQDFLAFGVHDIGRGRFPDQAFRHFHEQLAVLGDDPVDLVEELEDVLVRAEAQGPQENGGQELLLAVQADPEEVLRVVLELDPGSPVRDDLGDEEALVLGLPEEHPGRPLELADHDPFDPVEDEGPLFGHQGDVPEVDFLLLDVLEALGLGGDVLFPGHQLDLELEGDGEGVALLDALHGAVLDLEPDAVPAVLAERQLDLPHRGAVGTDLLLGELGVGREESVAGLAPGAGVLHALEPSALAFPGPDRKAEELQFGRLLEIGDGKDVLERRLEAGFLALLGQELHLEKIGIGLRLNVQKVGHGEDRLDLREVDPLPVRFFWFFEHAHSLRKSWSVVVSSIREEWSDNRFTCH